MKTLLASAFILFFLIGCSSDKDEVLSLLSPDKKVEAILFETNGGATTSYGYEVYFRNIDSGELTQVASFYGATRSNSAYGINLNWVADNNLELEYFKTKSVNLLSSSVYINNKVYGVNLKPNVNDSKAPPGGMLYNLNGRPYG